MRVFRQTYKDKDGKTKQVSKWWIELRDQNQIVRRFSGFADKRQTGLLGRQIERLINYKVAGEQPDPQLARWLEDTSGKIRDKLVKFGILDSRKAAGSKPLATHICDFENSLLPANGKSDRHVGQTARRVERIIEGCKFQTWSDISGSRIDEYIKELQSNGLAEQTAQHYIKAFRQFARWMVKEGRASQMPVIKSVKVPKRAERAFELDEFRNLLKATIDAPMRFGMAGFDRYVLYIVATETGLRRGELQSLTPASFNFKERTVFVKGESTKNSDDAVQQFSERTSALVQRLVANKMPNAPVFKIHDKSSKMIQDDCEAAGIEVVNNRGKIKFHSLRHTCGTFLADKGVHPKVIQTIMRHKDINLTMSRYTHTLRGQVAAAVSLMPDFTATATGTD